MSQASEGELGEKTLRRGGKNLTTGAPLDSGAPSGGGEISARGETPGAETQIIKMHQVSCLLDDAVMQMLDRCKALLSGKYPRGMSINIIIFELASAWLEKNDPVERNRCRAKTKKSQESKSPNHEEPSCHISFDVWTCHQTFYLTIIGQIDRLVRTWSRCVRGARAALEPVSLPTRTHTYSSH
jgi:hypothetical protein